MIFFNSFFVIFIFGYSAAVNVDPSDHAGTLRHIEVAEISAAEDQQTER